MTFATGDLIAGRYELGRRLGAGGMARVYLGHDRLLDRQVAVKVLSESYASDPNFVERFRREASAAAGLSHPNIVAVYDRGEVDGSYYIVMEYLPGPDLKEVIRREAPLPAGRAIDYALQILAALGAAHRRDVIHRDVKPQNVLLGEDRTLKVTDFGIARAGADSSMTEAGLVIGTAQYISPEQARGDEVTAASDCYSVGIVLYEMLTGRVPFDGERPVTVALKQISEPVVPPRALEPSVPHELDATVRRALAKRPSERFRTAGELTQALLDARAEIEGTLGMTRVMPAADDQTATTRVIEPTAPTRVARPAPPRRPPGGRPPGPPPPELPPRRRLWPVAIGLILLLAVIGGAAYFLLSDDGGGRAVQIPSVTGLSEEAARGQLTELGLEVSTERTADASLRAGLVIGTSPPAGSELHEGDPITLQVSSGPLQTSVPGVVGRTQSDAEALISGQHLRPVATSEASDTVDEGDVIRQDPQEGAMVPRDSEVQIVVSSGPEQITVPSVRGMQESDARTALEDRDLRVGTVTPQESDQADPGEVIGQTPEAGTKVDEDTAVNLVVATEPTTVSVPSVIGNTEADATAKLDALGFVVTTDREQSPEPAGNVIDQQPSSGSQVDRGATIVLTISTGPPVQTTPPQESPVPTSPTPTTPAAPPPP